MGCGCGKRKRPAAQPRGFTASATTPPAAPKPGTRPAVWDGQTATDDGDED